MEAGWLLRLRSATIASPISNTKLGSATPLADSVQPPPAPEALWIGVVLGGGGDAPGFDDGVLTGGVLGDGLLGGADAGGLSDPLVGAGGGAGGVLGAVSAFTILAMDGTPSLLSANSR